MSQRKSLRLGAPILLGGVAAASLAAFPAAARLTAQSASSAVAAKSSAGRASPAAPHLAQAQKALEAGDLVRARTELDLALEADPKSAEAFSRLGLMDLQSGDTAHAIEHYRRAAELEPKSFAAHYNLALACLRGEKRRDGLRELERAVALNPRHADAAYNLGLVLLDLGRPAEALTELRRARQLGPERPDVTFNIVRAELAARRFDEARQEAAASAKTLGKDADWRLAVGRLFLERGQPQVAALHLAEAFRLRPQSDDFRRALAAAYLESQEAARALPLTENPSTAEDYFLRASALIALRNFPEADQESARALQLAPAEPRYLVARARVAQYLGHQDAALELLKQASLRAPRWADPYYSSGVSYYFERRYGDARQSLDRALELDPRFVRALFLYALTLVNEGKNRQGENYLRRAIAIEPENARFEFHLGALLARDNRPSEARSAFEKSITLKPDYALPHYHLGKLLAGSSHPREAARELETAVRCDPKLAQAHYQLARAYTALGESEKSARALAAFNQLKKQEVGEQRELIETMENELQLSRQ